jgi:hypothetical protein
MQFCSKLDDPVSGYRDELPFCATPDVRFWTLSLLPIVMPVVHASQLHHCAILHDAGVQQQLCGVPASKLMFLQLLIS